MLNASPSARPRPHPRWPQPVSIPGPIPGRTLLTGEPHLAPQMMDALSPLGGHVYTLSLDYELNRWDLH